MMNGAICGYGAIGGRSYKTSAFRQDAIILWQAFESNQLIGTTVRATPQKVSPV